VNVLLLGPQGSGKGTQGKRIAEEYGIPHIASGDMLRAMKEEPTELGRELKAIMDRGDLVSDEFMIELFRDRLSREDAQRGFVLDGFPRNHAQAEALDDLLRELGRELDVVFDFQIGDEDTLFDRMQKRAVEEGRSDDTPEAFRRRLDLYYRETEPLIEHYRTTYGNVVGIHAGGSVNEVFSEIQQALEQVATRG
jgi:adenylate kinase